VGNEVENNRDGVTGLPREERLAVNRAALCAPVPLAGVAVMNRSVLMVMKGCRSALKGPANRFGLIAIAAGEASPGNSFLSPCRPPFGKTDGLW